MLSVTPSLATAIAGEDGLETPSPYQCDCPEQLVQLPTHVNVPALQQRNDYSENLRHIPITFPCSIVRKDVR